MPNHTTTKLEIKGPTEDIKAFISAVDTSKTKDGSVFDFNGVVPMPKELKGSRCPVLIQTQQEIDEAWERWNKRPSKIGILETPCDVGITQETYDRWLKEYGAVNWLDWACNNWGTKWGAYNQGEWEVSENFATICYETAWSPATEFFINASIKFPTISFQHIYADECGNYVGHETIKNGETIENISCGWDSEEGICLRKELGVFFEDTEEGVE